MCSARLAVEINREAQKLLAKQARLNRAQELGLKATEVKTKEGFLMPLMMPQRKKRKPRKTSVLETPKKEKATKRHVHPLRLHEHQCIVEGLHKAQRRGFEAWKVAHSSFDVDECFSRCLCKQERFAN